MARVFERLHDKKLKQEGIRIDSIYHCKDGDKTRSSDSSVSDDVKNGILLKKIYYQDGKLSFVKGGFDSRILYTFLSRAGDQRQMQCPNCGYEAAGREFLDGCPYCGTNFNMTFDDMEAGAKKSYDRILHSNSYRVTVYLVSLVLGMIISFLVIFNTSRIFNFVSWGRVIFYGLILSVVTYLAFYFVDARVVPGPIARYKDRKNQADKAFWLRSGIDQTTFYNNLQYELQRVYYGGQGKGAGSLEEDVVDFEIVDTEDFHRSRQGGKDIVSLTLYANGTVRGKEGRLSAGEKKRQVRLERWRGDAANGAGQDISGLQPGANVIICHNCGGSLDVTQKQCPFCGTRINFHQEWYIADGGFV